MFLIKLILIVVSKLPSQLYNSYSFRDDDIRINLFLIGSFLNFILDEISEPLLVVRHQDIQSLEGLHSLEAT